VKSSINKVLFFIIFTTLFFSLSGSTSADLSDKETISGNTMTASTLAISIRNTFNESIISQIFSTYGIIPSGFDLRAMRIKKEGLLDSNYNFSAIKTSGDDSFCNAIKISIMKDSKIILNGSINSLSLGSKSQQNPDDWVIFVGLDDNNSSLKNQNCNFNFVLKTNLNGKDGGFSDEHFIANNIVSGSWNN